MAKSTAPAPQVEVVSIDRIASSRANPRKHGDRNLAAIRDSLQQFGGARSIVIDGDGVVRAGNGTVEAARELGMTSILVVDPQPNQLVAVRRKEWSDAKAAAYEIADNRSGELAEWDQETLAKSLLAVQGEFDISRLGFSEQELANIVGVITPPTFAAPPTPPQESPESADDSDDQDQGEDQSEGDASPTLYPLAITLTRKQLATWHDLKQSTGIRKDSELLLHLVDIARPPSD